MGLLRNLFGGSDEEYERCGWCGRPIRYGENAVTVNLNKERAVQKSGQTVVHVSDSEVLLILCASCGANLDAGSLQQTLEAQRPARKDDPGT